MDTTLFIEQLFEGTSAQQQVQSAQLGSAPGQDRQGERGTAPAPAGSKMDAPRPLRPATAASPRPEAAPGPLPAAPARPPAAASTPQGTAPPPARNRGEGTAGAQPGMPGAGAGAGAGAASRPPAPPAGPSAARHKGRHGNSARAPAAPCRQRFITPRSPAQRPA